MRIVLVPVFAAALMGATDSHSEDAVEVETLRPAPELPQRDGINTLDRLIAPESSVIIGNGKLEERQQYLRKVCRDRIEKTREATGQPPLMDRGPASPDEGYAIYAVDRRKDGCGVMVMMGDRSDIRPLPENSEGPMLRRIPASDTADSK